MSLNSYRVLFLSPYTTKDVVNLRLLAQQSGVFIRDIQTDHLRDNERHTLSDARREIDKMALEVDDDPELGLLSIARKVHMLTDRGHRPDVVILDGLQAVELEAGPVFRPEEFGLLARGLKVLARRWDCPVVVTSQLAPLDGWLAFEKRVDKAPRLSDVQNLGGMDCEADMVIIMHRPITFWNEAQKSEWRDTGFWPMDERLPISKDPTTTMLHLLKQRNGPRATLPLSFDYGRTAFLDILQGRSWD